MTVPLVTAFSASCSAKSTVAPRPETSAGSRAARVTTGAAAVGGPAWAAPAAATPSPNAAAVTVTQRDGRAGHLAVRPRMLGDIESLVSRGGVRNGAGCA